MEIQRAFSVRNGFLLKAWELFLNFCLGGPLSFNVLHRNFPLRGEKNRNFTFTAQNTFYCSQLACSIYSFFNLKNLNRLLYKMTLELFYIKLLNTSNC